MTSANNIAMRQLCPETLQRQHAQLRSSALLQTEVLPPSIARLDAHNLEAQNDVALLNRVDSKYLLSLEQLDQILEDASSEYSVLEIDDHRVFTYQNTYFDSPSLRYFRHHHSGKLNRHKIRYRRYAETDKEYFEIKFKTNKKRTIKHRELLGTLDTAAQDSQDFAELHIDADEVATLQAVLHVNYRRLSLVDKAGTQRVTIDLDLRFGRVGGSELIHIPDLVIAELKQEKMAHRGFFENLMRSAGANKSNFSKYCVGCCLTADGPLKKNRFLPTLKRLQEYQQLTIPLELQPL